MIGGRERNRARQRQFLWEAAVSEPSTEGRGKPRKTAEPACAMLSRGGVEALFIIFVAAIFFALLVGVPRLHGLDGWQWQWALFLHPDLVCAAGLCHPAAS